MKYYCPICGSVFATNDKASTMALCPMCVTADGTHKIMFSIPKYETLAQYEKRTGMPYPETAPIWWRMPACTTMYNGVVSIVYGRWAVGTEKGLPFMSAEDLQVVCAYDTLEPPPDDWRPV